jgi:hypothetical protein
LFFAAWAPLVVASPALAQGPADPEAATPEPRTAIDTAPAEPAAAAPSAQPTPAEPMPVAAPATQPDLLDNPAPAVEPTEPAEAPPPDSLAVGKEKNGIFQPGALLQFWTTYSHQEDTPDTFAFRLRRAEIKVKGEIVPDKVSYLIMIDAAKIPRLSTVSVTDASGETVSLSQPGSTDQTIMQDFMITFMSDYADVSLGQFKIPVSMEGLMSSSKLLFPERADVSRAFGDRRDLGVKVEKKLGDYFYYYAGLFNGTGLNTAEVDNDKNGGLRLEVYPVKGLTVGALGFATIGGRDNQTTDRIEADVRYDANDIFAAAEYIRGWDASDGGAALEGHGAYLSFGYTIDKLQPVARIGFLDTDVDADDNGFNKYELGVNYFIQGHEAKLGLAAAFTDAENSDVPLRTDLTLLGQVSF